MKIEVGISHVTFQNRCELSKSKTMNQITFPGWVTQKVNCMLFNVTQVQGHLCLFYKIRKSQQSSIEI